LFEGEPRFVWTNEAKFKNLGAQSPQELAILTSFGVAVGRCAVEGTTSDGDLSGLTAATLRASILASSNAVGLSELLTVCWALGIPVLQLALFPLARKRMHAITVRAGDRYAVLIGRESKFRAQVAYIIAHEIGHVAKKHLAESAALVEVEDPLKQEMATSAARDDEEHVADSFALELLTGTDTPLVEADREDFTATQLAKAAIEVSGARHIEPGILALCLGHTTGKWKQAFGALKVIPPGESDVPREVNALAKSQLNWSALTLERRDFLLKVMGEPSAE
jgi:hypothetical protein